MPPALQEILEPGRSRRLAKFLHGLSFRFAGSAPGSRRTPSPLLPVCRYVRSWATRQAWATFSSLIPSASANSSSVGSRSHSCTKRCSWRLNLLMVSTHVYRHAYRAGLVGDASGYRLAYPPGGIGAELVPAAVIELLHAANEAQAALLDHVQQAHAAPGVLPPHAHPQPQVGFGLALASRRGRQALGTGWTVCRRVALYLPPRGPVRHLQELLHQRRVGDDQPR